MSNEKALFEDDILDGFEDVFASDPLEDFESVDPANDPFEGIVQTEVEAPQKEVVHNVPVFAMPNEEGGDRQLPAISINVFYEKEETRQLVEQCAGERRMGRATVESIQGGISAGIAYMA